MGFINNSIILIHSARFGGRRENFLKYIFKKWSRYCNIIRIAEKKYMATKRR